jgi:hypothetical protein
MDPYLEHPARWPGVHQGLIYRMNEMLNTLLPSGYAADMGERLYIVHTESEIYPDVVVVKPPSRETERQSGSGGTAVIAESAIPWILNVEPVEIREVFLEIVTVEEESRVVTTIEVLSPSNKAAGSIGRQKYRNKQRQILRSETHLLEIDLLRRGAHTVAAPHASLLEKGRWDYLICLHRGGQGGRYEVWPNTLRQPLPGIRIPLLEGDPDVLLDLQMVFDRCYDAGPYHRRIDYRQDPPSPLEGEDAAWADALLREQGLRL